MIFYYYLPELLKGNLYRNFDTFCLRSTQLDETVDLDITRYYTTMTSPEVCRQMDYLGLWNASPTLVRRRQATFNNPQEMCVFQCSLHTLLVVELLVHYGHRRPIQH